MSYNIDKFLDFLENHKEDRGMMSDLIRGLSPTTEHYA
jgi:hypothetical protein